MRRRLAAFGRRQRLWWAFYFTRADFRLLHALANGEVYAVEIARKYRLSVGQLYAFFAFWHAAKLITSWIEAPPSDGRPARRRYALLPGGHQLVEELRGGLEWARLDALVQEAGQ